MSKRVVYVAFWNTELNEMISFLKEHNYNEDRINAIEFVLKESQKLDKEYV